MVDLATNGIDIPDAITLSDATNSTSDANSGIAATPKAVKTAMDAATAAASAASSAQSTANTANSTANTAKTTATSAQTTATAAMPKSGGTYTGGVFGKTVAMSGSSINVSTGSVFTKTISSDTTFTISGAPSGACSVFTLVLKNGGRYTVTWPSSIKWESGVPMLSSSGTDVLTFITPNGGTAWYGVMSLEGAGASIF